MTPVRRTRRRRPPVTSTKATKVLKVATRPPTPKERFAAGHRDHCDICKAKIGTRKAGKRVEIWSFTVKGANGKVFNRCKRHLGTKVKV